MSMVVVFGGSFNPIHIGHTEIIEQICNIEDVDKVIIIPTKIPPHKELDYLADAHHRLNMCKLATAKFNKVEVSDLELKRDGKSYTIDTIKSLEKEHKNQKLALTIGGDMLVSFNKWKDYEQILKKCTLITFKRVGISSFDYFKEINKLKELGSDIISIETEISDVSSTQIRNELKNNIDSLFLDSAVKKYIIANNLYGV